MFKTNINFNSIIGGLRGRVGYLRKLLRRLNECIAYDPRASSEYYQYLQLNKKF